MAFNEPMSGEGGPSYAAQGDSAPSFSQWGSVQSDASDWSYQWDNRAAFEPQTFSQNTTAQKPCNNCCCACFFVVNFIIIVSLVGWLGSGFSRELNDTTSNSNWSESATPTPTPGPDALVEATNETSDEQMPASEWKKAIGVGIGIGVGLNVIHYLYATFAPLVYIKFGFFIAAFVALILSIFAVMISPLFLIFPAVFFLAALCMYCFWRAFIPFSAATLQTTTRIICQFPGIFVVLLVQAIIMLVGACLPIAGAGLATLNPNVGGSAALAVYFLFSFYWIILTVGYVTYLTLCGVGASWYFLNDTPYMPASATWESFKRAWTTSFGSAALAGFWLAVIQLLRALITKGGGGNDNCAIACLKCIVLCILACIENCIGFVVRYSLIYCATFGVPFNEGCRRWRELELKKFLTCLISGNIIDQALVANWVAFAVGGGFLSYGIGALLIPDYDEGRIWALVIGLFVTIAAFAVIAQPIQAISDTLLICWAEAPEQLQNSAADLYQVFLGFYGENAKKED